MIDIASPDIRRLICKALRTFGRHPDEDNIQRCYVYIMERIHEYNPALGMPSTFIYLKVRSTITAGRRAENRYRMIRYLDHDRLSMRLDYQTTKHRDREEFGHLWELAKGCLTRDDYDILYKKIVLGYTYLDIARDRVPVGQMKDLRWSDRKVILGIAGRIKASLARIKDAHDNGLKIANH